MTDLNDPEPVTATDDADEEPEAWLSSPLLVDAAAITGAPYKCPACGIFGLDEHCCGYCGWAGDGADHG